MFTINQDLCIRCGSCVRVCTRNVFRKNEDGSIAPQQEPCLDCFHCTATCPVQAIECDGMTHEECYPAPAPEGTLLSLLQRRRSIRHFKNTLPDRAVIQTALEGSAYGPSSKNLQGCCWSVVYGHEQIDRIYQLSLEWAKTSPEFRHLVWLDRRGSNLITCGAPCLLIAHHPTDCYYPAIDTAIDVTLAEHLLVEQGLGTCWGGYLAHIANESEEIRALLSIPEGHQVFAALMVGFSDERYPNLPPRKKHTIQWLG
ncbi:MAG: nitroreductase family protein [Oscillospiraceae bacterium]|nr:nitroreductase family protein [Oscillospiraceae bacterium]